MDSHRAEAALRRIAFEIAERHFGQPAPLLVGLKQRGLFLANQLAENWKGIFGLPLEVAHWVVPGSLAEAQQHQLLSKHSQIVLVDDVLYSGRTMYNALAEVMQAKPDAACVEVAVLINRGHQMLPIASTYTGLELATTLDAYVRMELLPTGKVEGYLE
jgi:pyrimidine operon attenuation protein/uracil phosphoribosyltransferase